MKVIFFNIKYLLIGCIIAFATNNAEALIVVENVSHTSDGVCNGAIDIAIVGDNGPYTFSWSNDVSSEDLDFLCPGTYTVTVTDIYGCEENLTIEIGGCALYINPVITPGCRRNSVRGSIVLNGNMTDYENYTVTWSGDESSSAIFLNEEALNLDDGIYCVSIEVDNNDGSENGTCELQQCFYINSVSDCSEINNPSSPIVIINEASNGQYFQQEYYELLVIGTGAGSCENPETIDLRGFIIDDNNGDFSNAPTSSPNAFETGVATGHIRFKYIERWKEVPVGSLILIYNNAVRTLIDDPEDSNGDMSYIVPITDNGLEGNIERPGLFTGLNYGGNYYPASWDAIPLYNHADAPQVRYPNGAYCHGISYGPSNLITGMTGGPHDLHVSTGDGFQKLFYLDGYDYLNKFHYKSDYIYLWQETPGYPNSNTNAEFIANLCVEGFINQFMRNVAREEPTIVQAVEERADVKNTPLTKEKRIVANVYPNPSAGDITLDLESSVSTIVTINIVTLYGQKLIQKKMSISEGKNTLKLNLKEKGILPSGVLLMNVIDESNRHLIDIFKIVLVEE